MSQMEVVIWYHIDSGAIDFTITCHLQATNNVTVKKLQDCHLLTFNDSPGCLPAQHSLSIHLIFLVTAHNCKRHTFLLRRENERGCISVQHLWLIVVHFPPILFRASFFSVTISPSSKCSFLEKDIHVLSMLVKIQPYSQSSRLSDSRSF